MADSNLFQENKAILGVLGLVISGFTYNGFSESDEDEFLEGMVSELRQVDERQDGRYADLLQKYNDLYTDFALLEQRLDFEDGN